LFVQRPKPFDTGISTDRGQVRQANEDFGLVRELPQAILLLVADGMGGHNGGRVASELAADTVVHEMEFADIEWKDPHQVRSLLEQSLFKANTEVYRAAQSDPEHRHMGTTLLTVVMQGSNAFIGHAGDSRLYLLRQGRAVRLTADHSRVQDLVASGKLEAREARGHPDAHLLTRAIGVAPELEPEVRRTPLKLAQFDVLVLCSDGLYEKVSGQEIAKAFKLFPAQVACERLVALANRRGGHDNITVAAYKWNLPESAVDKLVRQFTREHAGVPLWMWTAAGTLVALAGLLLGLAALNW
jgi:protein phosphatase